MRELFDPCLIPYLHIWLQLLGELDMNLGQQFQKATKISYEVSPVPMSMSAMCGEREFQTLFNHPTSTLRAY